MHTRREILAALAAVPSVVVAEDKPNFSGRWRLDPARSSREAPASLTETIDHRDPVIRIDSDWDRNTATGLTNAALLAPSLQLIANGTEVTNSMPLGMMLLGKSRWNSQALVTEWRLEGMKVPLSGTWRRRMNGADMIVDATTPGGARRFVFTRANL